MRAPIIVDPALIQAQPRLHAYALDALFYTDPNVFAEEWKWLFGSNWQWATHVSRLREPGDYALTSVGGMPLCVLRDSNGAVRTLHNVCRHRAGPLLTEPCGHVRSLRCRYHGWNYSLQGELLSAPEMEQAPGFALNANRLPQAPTGTWQGLVFTSVQPLCDFNQLCEDLNASLAPACDDYHFCQRVDYEVRCNWKVYVDNYLEGYHLPHVHPALNRMLDYRRYATRTYRWHSVQSSPLQGAQCWGPGHAAYAYLYPTTMLNFLPGRLQMNHVVPLSHRSCRVVFEYYYHSGQDAAYRDEDRRVSDEIQKEDIQICEAVQRGLESGSYRSGRLQPEREQAVHHFHELYRAQWRRAAASCGDEP